MGVAFHQSVHNREGLSFREGNPPDSDLTRFWHTWSVRDEAKAIATRNRVYQRVFFSEGLTFHQQRFLIVPPGRPAILFFLRLTAFLLQPPSLATSGGPCCFAKFWSRLTFQQHAGQLLAYIRQISALVTVLLAMQHQFALAINSVSISRGKPSTPGRVELFTSRRRPP